MTITRHMLQQQNQFIMTAEFQQKMQVRGFDKAEKSACGWEINVYWDVVKARRKWINYQRATK